MQIAFCIFKYFPYGGIQRDLMKLARECLARGHSVRIYVARWDAPLPDQALGIQVVVAPVKALTNHRRYERFAAWVLGHLRRHPVHVVVGMNKMPGLDVYYAGDSSFQEKARTQRGAAYRLLPRYRHFVAFERAVFDAAVTTRILTISDQQTPLFRKYYGTPADRFHPLPPGIDADRRAPHDVTHVRAEFRREFMLKDDDLLLLFIGSGFIKKGLDRALLAFRALPAPLSRRTKLFVIGHDNAEPFRRMANRLGVGGRVRFFAGRDDIPRFLFGADGLVLPAYDENAGMVIIEAMIAGLPALVTGNCGYAHFLRDAGAGIVLEQPFDQQRLDAALVELLSSAERQRWRANGLKMADEPAIYQLAERAVDVIERAAVEKRPVLAFALWRLPAGARRRDLLQITAACRDRGYHVRIYAPAWEGEKPMGIEVVELTGCGIAGRLCSWRFARLVKQDLAWRPASGLVGFDPMRGLDVYIAADGLLEGHAGSGCDSALRSGGVSSLLSRLGRKVFGTGPTSLIIVIGPLQGQRTGSVCGIAADRVEVLPPGIPRDRRRPDDAEAVRAALRSEFAIGEADLLILFRGADFVTQGLDRTLMAVASLPESVLQRVQLFVLGAGDSRAHVRLAKTLGIAARVRFFPDREDVTRFLLGSDVLVYPAHTAMPLESEAAALLEAVVAGLPVIATDVCALSSYVARADAGTLVASPFRQETLNVRLAEVLQDAARRQRWSENGARFGRDARLHDMASHAAELIEERIGGKPVSA